MLIYTIYAYILYIFICLYSNSSFV